MMATVASLVVDLKANTAAFTSGLKTATSSVASLEKTLKGMFGRGSAFKETLEILAGGGAVAGLGMLANSFANIGSSVRQMSLEVEQGKKSINDLIESAVRSIPILGGLAGGITDIGVALNVGGVRDRIVAQQANAGIGDLFNSINSVISPKSAGQQQVAAMRAQASQISLAGGMGPGQFQMFTRIIDEAERRIQNAENAANAKKLGAPTVDLAKSVYNIDTDPLAQAILSTAKAMRQAEDKFNALSDAADRAERTAVLIGVNDPLTQNILETAQNRRRGLVSAAGGILSQLAAQQNAGPRFAGADIAGSQSEFAGRQRALFAGMNIDRKDEKELAKEAVRLAREQITKQEETNEILKRAVDQAEVVNF